MRHLPKNIRVRVMAEYGSSGVWEYVEDDTGPWRHTMITHHRLGLSKDLSARLTDWIRIYEDENLSGELDHVSFNATGLALAYEIYVELGKSNAVEFQGESRDGGLEEPVEIENL